MDREFLTDEDIHGCEEDRETTILQNKLDKANERIEELEDELKDSKQQRQAVLNFIEVGFNQQTVGYSNYINIKQLLKSDK